MLVAPFLLAMALIVSIQTVDHPSSPNRAYQATSSDQMAHAEGRLRDRVSIMVLFEILALTLIIRPWEFPWSAVRFLFAEVALLPWGALVIPMSMHMGRLMAYHALAMMGLLGFVIPLCIVSLGTRYLFEGE